MFCSRCGTQNTENNQFCTVCGNDLKQQQIHISQENNQNSGYQGVPYQGPTDNFVMQQTTIKELLSKNPVLNAVKQLGTSPLYLIATIAFSASLLFSLCSALSWSSSGLIDNIEELSRLFGVSYYFNTIYNFLQGAIVGGTILGMIPSILVAIGLWMIFASAMDRSVDGMKVSGFTVIKVINIITLVGWNICYSITEIILIIAIININDSWYVDDGAVPALVVCIILVIGITVFVNLYYVKIIQTINAIKMTIHTAIPSVRVSSFIAVMCFISAFFTIFKLFSGGGFFTILSVLSSITASICFGILLFTYKNKMLTLMSNEK